MLQSMGLQRVRPQTHASLEPGTSPPKAPDCLSYLILRWHFSYPHFPDGETEVQNRKIACLETTGHHRIHIEVGPMPRLSWALPW